MSQINREDILNILKDVTLPSGETLDKSPVLTGLVIRDGQVGFAIDAAQDKRYAADPSILASARADADKRLKDDPRVTKATVVLTGGGEAAAPAAKPPQPEKPANTIKHIVAVASGKGGVGKSTVAANLACGLGMLGLKVGLMDADVYGPSVQRLLNLTDKPVADGKMLQPMDAFGIKAMTMGLLVDQDTAMVWRGAMVGSAITQLLNDVAWGDLDILVVDMPPGTGDAQLTLAQRAPLSGAVIVSTPQDLALIDARKGIAMFEKVKVPILGIVENMSVHICPSCGAESHIFGHGGAEKTAAEKGIAFLGALPLHMEIRETGDAGRPVVTQGDGPHAQAFLTLASQVVDALETADNRPPPKLVMQ